jgi:hypothetical protein
MYNGFEFVCVCVCRMARKGGVGEAVKKGGRWDEMLSYIWCRVEGLADLKADSDAYTEWKSNIHKCTVHACTYLYTHANTHIHTLAICLLFIQCHAGRGRMQCQHA